MNAHTHILPKTTSKTSPNLCALCASAVNNTIHPQSDPLDERPHSIYELLTRQMLEALRSDLNEIKARVNTLLWITLGAVILDFIMRLAK